MATKSSLYHGVLPAMPCPFRDDLSIDEDGLRALTEWLLGHDGITGLVPNGHTGEVNALTAPRRAEVTRIVADQARGRAPVISGLNCEGIAEASEHAAMARDAGAQPPSKKRIPCGSRIPQCPRKHRERLRVLSGCDPPRTYRLD